MSQQPHQSQADWLAVLAASEAFRRASLQVRAQYMREFVQLWPILSRERDLDRWLRLNVALVRRWQTPARSMALDFYASMRDLQNLPEARPAPVEPMPDREIVANLIVRGPQVARKARLVGLDELEAWERAEAAAMASGGRLVLNGGRDTLGGQEALGWMRVTDGDPCYFCAMLASRGAVYSSEQVALFSSRPDRLGKEYHDACGCTAAPIFHKTDFMSPEAMRFRDLWEQTGRTTGETTAGNKVSGIAYFRAVHEGRAVLPDAA